METIIVEDEINAKEALERLLAQYCPFVNVIAHARTLKEASQALQEFKPKLIFLDIQLGKEKVFSLFEEIDSSQTHVIFATAYDQYAVEAFRLAAVDYLLKPVNPERLTEAVKKAQARESGRQSLELKALITNFQQSKKARKIVLSTAEMMHVVDLENIVSCQSSQNYTTFNLQNGHDIIVSRTLKEFEEILSPQGFYRIHKSWLVNLSFVKAYDKREGGRCIMTNGTEIPVSPLKKEGFLSLLQAIK